MGHGKERFSTQEMANALAVRHAHGHYSAAPPGGATAWCSPAGNSVPPADASRPGLGACPGARYVVGADITLRHVSPGGCGISGQVTRTQTRTLAFTRTPAYFRALAAFISELCAELPRQSVLGVGLSIPGIIGSGQDLVLRSHALSIQGLRADEFEQYLGLPCRMINDANAGCLAEAWADVSLRDAVYLSLSNSVGSAVLIGPQAVSGAQPAQPARWGHPRWFPADGRATAAKAAVWTPTAAPACCTATPAAALKDFFLRLHTGDAALRSVGRLSGQRSRRSEQPAHDAGL